MTEETRLRGSATLRRTINLGNYSSITVEATAQFFQDAETLTQTLNELDRDILQWLDVRGIKNEVKAVSK